METWPICWRLCGASKTHGTTVVRFFWFSCISSFFFVNQNLLNGKWAELGRCMVVSAVMAGSQIQMSSSNTFSMSFNVAAAGEAVHMLIHRRKDPCSTITDHSSVCAPSDRVYLYLYVPLQCECICLYSFYSALCWTYTVRQSLHQCSAVNQHQITKSLSTIFSFTLSYLLKCSIMLLFFSFFFFFCFKCFCIWTDFSAIRLFLKPAWSGK